MASSGNTARVLATGRLSMLEPLAAASMREAQVRRVCLGRGLNQKDEELMLP